MKYLPVYAVWQSAGSFSKKRLELGLNELFNGVLFMPETPAENGPMEPEIERPDGREDPLDVYLRHISQIPFLSEEEERDVCDTMKKQRKAYREELLESPYVARQIWEDYKQVCMGDLSVYDYSKDARKPHQAKPELHNSAEEVVSGMQRYRQRGSTLANRQQESFRTVAEQVRRGKKPQMPVQLHEYNARLREIIERFQPKEEWLFSRCNNGSDLQQLWQHMQTATTAEELAQCIEQAGETPASLNSRLQRSAARYEEWQQAKWRLVESHLPLVVSIAKEFRDRGVSFSDLIQEGNISLLKAADTFDSKYKAKFETHATHQIRCELQEAVERQPHVIRITDKGLRKMRRVREFIEAYTEENAGVEPSIDVIVDQTGLCAKDVMRIESAQHTVSLHSLCYKDGDSVFENLVPAKKEDSAEEMLQAEELQQAVHCSLESLQNRYRYILKQIYYEQRTRKALGAQLHCPATVVSKGEKIALQQIRDSLELRPWMNQP